MIEREATIVNQLGLHARPAAKIVKLASGFAAEIEIVKDGMAVNGKSIMGVMMLAAGKGAKVVVDCDGERADEALAALQTLIAERFGEGE